MVCPACGETLELEGYKAGDLVDCEACGAVLRLLSDGTLELVEAPPEEEGEALWGLTAYGEGEEAVLVFSDGTLEEEVRTLKADLLEALRRLEEGVGEEPPKEAEDEPNLEPDYLTAHVETDQGPMALRRILFPGSPDLLEFTLPSGSVYQFTFREVRELLKPILL
ncbi:TFIIB-type zinc ribbon-containing protein [Thermus tengchongensis]|uniref:TFIIB-type zinc ribbon-containing protein n=1 Tax=Thermus tengchongensis TaxID=1214928 RepID=A0A4Y9FGQ0_9DEIN|nr:TFIIB-type zinc ribbon-containing protein [Thermus tengchongensis]TFU27649.1 TFIIB-type zinc ribbon-containing protein [Thermus tengchongensis]